MITNYKQFNESLRDKLAGPTEDEVWDNIKDLNPNDLFKKSCQIGFLKGVEIALNRGANIHVGTDYALRFASLNGHVEIVKLLLDNGVDIHSVDDYALRFASRYGHTETVKILLDRGADINIGNGLPLKNAIQNGHTETAELIKKYMENK